VYIQSRVSTCICTLQQSLRLVGLFFSLFPSRCWLVDLIVYTVPLLLLLPGMPTNKNTREENGLASGRARAFPIAGFCRVAIKVGPPQQKEAELNLKTLAPSSLRWFCFIFPCPSRHEGGGVTNQREEVYSIPYICPAIVYTLQSSMCAVYMYAWRVMGTATPPPLSAI
jgi:hypothetical protein